MFRILLLLAMGVGIGYVLRRSAAVVRGIEKSTRYTIFLLLFVFGVSIGSNRSIIDNIAGVGMEAFVIAFLGIAGSFAAASLFKCLVSKRKGGGK
ncbi:MAG: lysine exporter LysO family protein [Bacteroides sp.]|nr:lysine exporter LysO family protein [Roseburia sp.]MCM1345925.1 lysine exporter LysO family protein [Bacteroides sp.]MCM1420090.1 lysine exporter LysO family protein [Bacteroides sp.]